MSLDPFLSQSQDHGGPQMPQLKAEQRLFNRRYELRQLLGAGGMGVVWLARDHTEEIDVALKFLPSVLVLQEGEMKRLREEVRAGKELRHPRLVATYGMEIEDGIAAIVMEFVPGQTLRQKLDDQEHGFFEPEEITGWVKDMTDGLGYLHEEAKRIHRDLKPANVMIDAEGRAKLMDFGISHRIKEGVSKHSKTNEGAASSSSSTLAYASPQQLSGRPSNKADDIYSLGATVYELLTGTPPFFRGGMDAVRGQIKEEAPTPIMERRQELVDEGLNRGAGKKMREGIEQAVMACLAKDRDKRPDTCAVLRQAITGLAAHGGHAASAQVDDGEARRRSALEQQRKEEERQMAAERKRAREMQEQKQREAQAAAQASHAQAGAQVPPPASGASVYAEYFCPGMNRWSYLQLASLPVSPRGSWPERKAEADQILQHLGTRAGGRQVASSAQAAMAFAKHHAAAEVFMLCCEVRPDHVCCSLMEMEDNVYEELGSWMIDSAGLTDDRLAARVWAAGESVRAQSYSRDKSLQCCAVTHSNEASRAQARGLAAKLPGKVWLWEDDLPAALSGAQSGAYQMDTLLLSSTPYALSLRLPDQSLEPIVRRFTNIPKLGSTELDFPSSSSAAARHIELVEEMDQGLVVIASQRLTAQNSAPENGSTKTKVVVDIDAGWNIRLKLTSPAPEPAPASASAPPPVPPASAETKKSAKPSGPTATPRPPAADIKAAKEKRLSGTLGVVAALLLAGTFGIAKVMVPEWDHVVYWRNGTWVLYGVIFCANYKAFIRAYHACDKTWEGYAKCLGEVPSRWRGPLVVTLIAAVGLTIHAWKWPKHASAVDESPFRGMSEHKVFTAPSHDAPPGNDGPPLGEWRKAEMVK